MGRKSGRHRQCGAASKEGGAAKKAKACCATLLTACRDGHLECAKALSKHDEQLRARE